MFSDSQIKVLGILGKKTMTINEIKKKYFKTKAPLYANNFIAQVIRTIENKCKINELSWTIKGEGLGRAGKKVRVIRANNRRTNKRNKT